MYYGKVWKDFLFSTEKYGKLCKVKENRDVTIVTCVVTLDSTQSNLNSFF